MSECNRELLREIFARGLVSGIGNTDQTCIEGAIALACGLPLSDMPPCVAAEDRAFAIRINDAAWSSPAVRAEALLPLAFAQIGTTDSDRRPWVRRLVEGTIRRVLPVALRAAAWRLGDTAHGPRLAEAADECEREGSVASARRARDAADAADAAAAYAADAAAYAYDAAAYDAAAAAAADAAAAAAAAYAAQDFVLRLSVEVALDAYRAEGRA